MKTIRIKTETDLSFSLPTQDGPIQLEIYLKNAVLPITEWYGNIKVRAVNCSFPHLLEVKGDLSIDASNACFPVLQIVLGTCNVHELGAELPKLNRVGGKLTVLKPTDLSTLLWAGKFEGAKEIETSVPNIFELPFIEVKTQAEADALPEHGCYNLNIDAPNLEITSKNIYGIIQVNADRIRFSSLEFAYQVKIGNENKSLFCYDIDFSRLEQIQGKLHVAGTDIFFPSLKQVGKLLYISHNSIIVAPELEIVQQFRCNSTVWMKFPKLHSIRGDFTVNPPVIKDQDLVPDAAYPELRFLGGDLNISYNFGFPQLSEIRGRLWNYDYVLPKLESVKQVVTRKIYNRLIEKTLPKLKHVDRIAYNEQWQNYTDKVDDVFYQAKRGFSLSENNFIVYSEFEGNSFLDLQTHPLPLLVSILKMSHDSIQRFENREFDREWDIPEFARPKILAAFDKIWSKIKPLTYEQLFKIENRLLRRFAFQYIGISVLMEKLGAERIATEGIELNYFRYDEQGQKVPFRKHNIYEIYQADGNLLGSDFFLGFGRTREIYAVKCWCSSTEHEHWLWISPEYKDDPLAAIASTFRVHENVIPYIKRLKRQGDVLICEMNQQVIPEGRIRPLTKDEYFGMLEVET